jgi:hypothetical protein
VVVVMNGAARMQREDFHTPGHALVPEREMRGGRGDRRCTRAWRKNLSIGTATRTHHFVYYCRRRLVLHAG